VYIALTGRQSAGIDNILGLLFHILAGTVKGRSGEGHETWVVISLSIDPDENCKLPVLALSRIPKGAMSFMNESIL